MTNTTMNNGANNNGVNGGMNMINTTEFNNVLTGLNRKEEVEVNDVNFMNRMANDYGTSIQGDKNKGVGQITIASNTFSAIALLDDAEFKPLAFKALEIVLGKMEGFNTGIGDYLGLLVEEVKADKVNMDYITVSAKQNDKQEEAIIQEMISCDLNDVKNLRKIFADINDLFRMYQELTIDAAKKLYEIEAVFHNNIMKASSTIAMKHNFNSFKEMDSFEIVRDNRYAIDSQTAIGEMVEFKNNEGELKKIVFNDKISVIQDTVARQIIELVNGELKAKYDSITVSEDVEASFGIGSEFSHFAADMYAAIRKPYSKLTAWKLEEEKKANEQVALKKISAYKANKRIDEVRAMYDEKIAELSNLARFLTKDMDMALAGRLMFMISNIKREKGAWVVDKDSTNQLFLAVAPELFLAYIVEEHAEMKVCGYRVLGNTSNLVEGQTLTFVNGNAVEVENVYVDALYNGELTVQMIDGVLSVVKPIEIERIEATTPKEMVVEIYENSVIDAVHFAKTKERVMVKSFKVLEAQNVLTKAEKVQVVPFYSYINAEGKTKCVYNAIVATISSINDPSIKYEIPVAQYLCNSATMEKFVAGITAKSFGKTRIDGKTMRISLDYSDIQEVEMNHAKAEIDINDVEGINNDPFAVKTSNATYNANVEDPFAPVAEVTSVVNNIESEAFGSGEYAVDLFDGITHEEFDEIDYSIFDTI